MQYFKTSISTPLNCISCGHFIATEEWIHPRRKIDSAEIIIVTHGTIHMEQGKEHFEIGKGEMLILPPCWEHKGCQSSPKDTSFYWLHFMPEKYDIANSEAAFSTLSLLGTNVSIKGVTDCVWLPIHAKLHNYENAVVLAKQTLHIYLSGYHTPLAADYAFTTLMIELCHQTIEPFARQHTDPCVLSQMIEWMRINITKELSVEQVAKKFHYNTDYFTRMFKKETGQTPKHFMNAMKISQSKELLCMTGKSIKEIAYLLGFKDEKYYSKLFKSYEGLSPFQYKNTYYKTHLNNK